MVDNLNSLREVNRFNLDKLFELREGVTSKQDVLVELSIDDMHFFLGFDEIYRAILNTNLKIIDERFNIDTIIVSEATNQHAFSGEETIVVEVEDDYTPL